MFLIKSASPSLGITTLEAFKVLQMVIAQTEPLDHTAPLQECSWTIFDIWRMILFCSAPAHMPKLFINRRSAAEHRADPTQDPDAKHSILNQVSSPLLQFQFPLSILLLMSVLCEISFCCCYYEYCSCNWGIFTKGSKVRELILPYRPYSLES